jgi:uncharacterized OB-fold protein
MKEIALVAYRCKKCGKVHYPYHDRCLACKGREFETIRPEGRARLLTFTQIFNLPWGFNQRFLIIGIAQFENGIKAMGQVKADSVADLKPGMEMEPRWEAVRVDQSGEEVYGLKFEPCEMPRK